MQSSLHERLEYLINYSSQLIFVSGDSVAQQKKTLDAFVFNQNDDTDIAYLTAKPGLDLSDYRLQLCHQLLGQQVGSYVRPLNELLAALNEHQGPVLITITQAEYLPDALLQELWDLVLQSRFASNKQHLNVLLFGQSAWAESAKQWLPAKNTSTPLLISSQSVMARQVGSELDEMISQRRQAFQARLDERNAEQYSAPKNRLKSPWLWGSAVLTFVASFTAIFAWQYESELGALFSPIDDDPVEAVSPAPPGSAYQELLTAPAQTVLDNQSQNTVNEDEAAETSATGFKSEQSTITDWQTAVKNMKTVNASDKQRDEDAGDSTLTEKSSTNGVSEEPVPFVDAAVAAELLAAIENQEAALPEASPSADTTAKDTGLDNTTLTSLLTADDFVIQLAGLKDKALLQAFISDHQLQDKVWIYQTQRYGGSWFVLLFRQPFGSVTEARQAMALLPDFPGKKDAFVKSASQVLNELKTS